MDYFSAAERNPRLLDGLNAKYRLDVAQHSVMAAGTALPRAFFPKSVIVTTGNASAGQLESLGPAETALSPVAPAAQDSSATATVTEHAAGRYRIHCRAGSESLLVFSEPWYPGWEAVADGKTLRVVRADHALIGVVVPAGETDVDLRFHLPGFAAGAAISTVAFFALVTLLLAQRRSLSLDEA